MIEFTLGRESGTDMPRLAVTKDGKTFFFGAPGSVPQGVSRLHCRVIVEDDAKITIEDVTDNNLMFVNGLDCKRKHNVGMDDTVELGACKYKLELEAILKALSANQSFSIAHLARVYDDYQQKRYDIQVSQGKLNALSAIPGFLTTASIVVAIIIEKARVYFIIVAAIFAVILVIIRYKKASEIPIKSRKMDEDFRDEYICPNPACHHFLGMTPYKDLLKNRSCPFCRAKFTE